MKNTINSTETEIVADNIQPQLNLFNKNKKPHIILDSEHTELYKNISHEAVNVLDKLKKANYQAFLVGGGVRDILLNRKPKDFDIVTDAHPKEVRALFKNSRLIGRRFVIAHVYFGRKIIEVSTFRAGSEKNEERLTDNGRILQDNVYSCCLDEDVWRRDFTINALYYDIHNLVVWDYTEGLADLRAGIIRLIGDPILRYKEDPVRLLRAARFAAKLGFDIESQTADPIYNLGKLLHDVPRSRLYDEVLKLFLTGHAVQSLAEMRKYHLFQYLFPMTEEHFDQPMARTLIEQALQDTDTRLAENKPVTPAFLFAALLWPAILNRQPHYRDKGLSEQDSLFAAIRQVLNRQTKCVSIPRRISLIMKDIWLLQLRLTHRKKSKKQRLRIMEHRYFRAAYDFLLLRAKTDESVKKWADWWTAAQGEGENKIYQR